MRNWLRKYQWGLGWRVAQGEINAQSDLKRIRDREKAREREGEIEREWEVWMWLGQQGLNFAPQTGLKLDTGLRTRQSSFNTPVIVDQITYSECSLSLSLSPSFSASFFPSGRALSEILFALNRHSEQFYSPTQGECGVCKWEDSRFSA